MCIWHLTTAFMHKLEPKIPNFLFLAFFRKKEKIRGIELTTVEKTVRTNKNDVEPFHDHELERP